MNLSEFVMNVFMIVGMLVCIIVTAIALFYGTCYFVRILIKTFNTKVKTTTELMLEDMKEKNIAKKERNKEKREALKKQKEEKLQLKLESKEEIHKMKLQRYQNKLYAKENKNWEKMFGETPRKEFRDHKIDVFQMGKENVTEEEPLTDEEEKKVDFEPQIITGEGNDFVKPSGELDEDVTTDLSGSVDSNEETNLPEDDSTQSSSADENSSDNTNVQEDLGDGLNLSEITDTTNEQESSNGDEEMKDSSNADSEQIQTESEVAQEQVAEKQESANESEPQNENETDLKPQGIFDETEKKENSIQDNSQEKHKKWRWGKKK